MTITRSANNNFFIFFPYDACSGECAGWGDKNIQELPFDY
jgi:hypothetical protein